MGFRWSLLDQRHPEVGLRLLYTGGSRCGRNRGQREKKRDGTDGEVAERSTEFHFECNRKAGKVGAYSLLFLFLS